jgi:death on curing protein
VTEWKWLTREAIEIIHREQLREHGGLTGIKDENALEAAIARPQHKAAYENPDVYELAAAYLFGIARNHPFADGNKRTAFLAAYTFLAIHSQRFTANQGEVIEFVLEVAAGQVNESGIAKFLRDHTEALN